MVQVFRKCASELNELINNEVHLVLEDMIRVLISNDQNIIVVLPKKEVNNV